MRTLRHRLKNAEGAEIAEAAMVLPVVFVFLLGIIWFGRAFNIYSTITQAAQQGAIVAARPTCATCAAPAPNWNSTSFPADGSVFTCPNPTVACAVAAVMQASNLDPTLIPPNTQTPPSAWCDVPPAPAVGSCSVATTTSNITICREVWLNSPNQPQICGSLVSFQYNFEFYLPFTSLNLTQVKLSAQAQSRMEN